MDKHSDTADSWLGGDAPDTPAAIAAALALPAASRHFDELRRDDSLRATWARFFASLGRNGLGDLDRRADSLEWQLRGDELAYNAYADAQTPQRPWALDLFPLLVEAQDWQRIEAGVLQRVRLLDHILADVYGPQELLAHNLLPPALVQGHRGFLRAMHGVQVPSGTRLHVAAFDLARDANGAWWVVSQRTQAPSGLGYVLESRLIASRLFPDAFRDMRVQRLAGTWRSFANALRAMCPARADGDAHVVLLTPSRRDEHYFEHAFLAHHLGLTLAEGSDLTVRGDGVFLKTLQGLDRVHGILNRLDDDLLDPLELLPDSHLGVPGLLQAVRAGTVLVANAPGSAFLESPAILGFLPPLSQQLLGEELLLPSLATWWCGERAATEAVLPQLSNHVIKPTYGGRPAVPGHALLRRELDEWTARIARAPDEYTVQAVVPLARMPTWARDTAGSGIVPRSYLLRVFALADGPQSWRVLPGGLARLTDDAPDMEIMPRGGSSADTWVLTEGEVDTAPSLRPPGQPAATARRPRAATSRIGESLFWLGRYSERTENTARLARLALESLAGEDQGSHALLDWITQVCRDSTLVPSTVPPATQARGVFERALIAALADTENAASVGFNLRALRDAAWNARERLSREQWNLIERALHEFVHGCTLARNDGDLPSVEEALRMLEQLASATAAMTGAQADRMLRDDGWRLLSIGRHIERLGFLARALGRAFDTGAVHDEAGFEAILALFDSSLAFRVQYAQRSDDIPALLELLVLDSDNPRSLGCVARTLNTRLAQLPASATGDVPALALTIPDSPSWSLAAGSPHDAEQATKLAPLLQELAVRAKALSEDIVARYFAHAAESRSVGA